MRHQVVVIHGGNASKNYKIYIKFLKGLRLDFARYLPGKRNWKGGLGKALGKKFEVIMPDMPNKMNAQYPEWKIWFEKFIPYMRSGVVLVGHSLGATFLTKYLSEVGFPKKIRATLLISAAVLTHEGGFTTPQSMNKFAKQGGKIFLYHSKDDPVVPFGDIQKYKSRLKTATIRIFKNKGHFNQERFPELVKDLRKLF